MYSASAGISREAKWLTDRLAMDANFYGPDEVLLAAGQRNILLSKSSLLIPVYTGMTDLLPGKIGNLQLWDDSLSSDGVAIA